MRSSVVGSGLIHLTLLLALFIVPKVRPAFVPGPEVIQVALIEPSAIRPRPVPSLPPERPVKQPEVRPTEETGVKLTPPKPPPRKKQPEVEEKPKESAPEAAAPTLPLARLGPAGLSGAIRVDAASFEFTYYLLLIRNRVAENWSPPAGLATGGAPVRAVVYFRISRGGRISAARVEETSPVEFFDRSALRAVMISDPFPPLPVGFGGTDLGVHFGFEYSAP